MPCNTFLFALLLTIKLMVHQVVQKKTTFLSIHVQLSLNCTRVINVPWYQAFCDPKEHKNIARTCSTVAWLRRTAKTGCERLRRTCIPRENVELFLYDLSILECWPSNFEQIWSRRPRERQRFRKVWSSWQAREMSLQTEDHHFTIRLSFSKKTFSSIPCNWATKLQMRY